METHLKNTWEWDKWGFTSEWDNGCTLSDIDGFYPHFAEVSSKFILIEVKHWDGDLPLPEIPHNSGQAKALWALSQVPNFTVIWAYGNTETRQINGYEIWTKGSRYPAQTDFKTYLTQWFKVARSV
jgi:hypothetical protein